MQEKIQSWKDQIKKFGQSNTFKYVQQDYPNAMPYFMLAVKEIEMEEISVNELDWENGKI